MDNKMRTAWIAFAMIVACAAWGQLQPPAPTPTEKSSPPQKTTQNKGHAASSDQRGTEERPLFAKVSGVPVVEVQSGPKTEQKAAKTADKENDAPALYWGLPADAWAALFTLGLLITGTITAVFFIWQSMLLRRQVTLAREEFISSNRPRIILREAYTAPDYGHPITAFYALANVGGTKATIVESKFCIFITLQGGTKRQIRFDGELLPGEIPNPVPIGREIEAGGFHESSCASPTTHWSNNWGILEDKSGHQTIIMLGMGNAHLYFYGKVSYKDASGVIRNMAFYRILDLNPYRFIPFGDPQLEYSDERP
jgi:hypothetical protein